MKLNKIVFACLTTIFLLSECNAMEKQLAANLGTLKDSLGQLKAKLESLGSKMEDLQNNLSGAEAIKKFTIDNTTYTCEFWKVSKLKKWVDSNCKNKKIGKSSSFNVIDRSKDYPADGNGANQFTESSVVAALKNPKKGTVFQLAANDSVAYTWCKGRSHAGYIVTNTKLGQAIRKDKNFKNIKDLNQLFEYASSPKYLNYEGSYAIANNTVCLNSVGEADNPDNIYIAVFKDLQTVNTPSQEINVVLTAAYPGGVAAAESKYPGKGKEVLKNCLTTGYDGILLSAIMMNKPDVILTFIGGHAFKGIPNDTIEAIENAVRKFVIQHNLNVSVYLDDASLGNTPEERQKSDNRLKALEREFQQKRQITDEGINYGISEYWKFSELEKYVTTHNFEPFKQKAAFNVIERGKLGDEKTAFNKLVGNPNYNGAVFQVAANDNVSGMWNWGGVQAGYFVNATKLGSITRSKGSNFMDSFFAGSPLPQKSGHLTLCTTGKDPLDINNIFINIHSDLEIKDDLVQDKTQKQIIHASITAGYSGGRNSAISAYGQENGIKIAQNCLTGGYEGTLLAAILLRSPTVVLTFLGCHVFANDPKDVFNAIAQAVRTYVKKYNLNVTAYLDDTTQFSEEDDQNFLNLRKEINGEDSNIDPTPIPVK